MACRAVGLHAGVEAMRGLRCRMADGALFLVTRNAARGRRSADRFAAQIVALRARDVLSSDVHSMPVREPRPLPSRLHAEPRWRRRIRACPDNRQNEHEQSEQWDAKRLAHPQREHIDYSSGQTPRNA